MNTCNNSACCSNLSAATVAPFSLYSLASFCKLSIVDSCSVISNFNV